MFFRARGLSPKCGKVINILTGPKNKPIIARNLFHMVIFNFLLEPDNSQDKLMHIFLIFSVISLCGLFITIFAIVMWVKKDRLLKKIAKDRINEVVAREMVQHLEHNLTLDEMKAIIQKEIWKNKEVYIEEIKTESTKEISQQRIIKITVEDKNENSGFRSFFVKLTPTWLIEFIHERRQATRKRNRKK